MTSIQAPKEKPQRIKRQSVNQNFKAHKVNELLHVDGKTMREAILTLNKYVDSVYDKETTGIPAL